MAEVGYRNDVLHVEGVSIEQLAATYGTPCYVYSRARLEANFRSFTTAFEGMDHLICYSVKACSNIAILKLLADLGSGFDIVSGGELSRVLAAGGDPGKIVFSGVGKLDGEMEAALAAGIRSFNVESAQELRALEAVAHRLGRVAPVSIRVNPDVDPQTHPYIATGLRENKFGIGSEQVREIYRQAAASSHLRVLGIDCHIGSQLTDLTPIGEALDRCLELVDDLRQKDAIDISHLDLGGGLGIRYQDESVPSLAAYAGMVRSAIGDRNLHFIVEPGRRMVGDTGLLLTRVVYLKSNPHKNFAIVDAAMNDLIRPALYDAWHDILPGRRRAAAGILWDLVGPVCESGDFLGRGRRLALEQGDLLAVNSCGAYGMVMSSNYNTRSRPPEVIVDGDRSHLVRRRETIEDQLALERLLPD